MQRLVDIYACELWILQDLQVESLTLLKLLGRL